MNNLDNLLHELVVAIDNERTRFEEEIAKKSYQYKSSGKYKRCDQKYIEELIIKRNTLVEVINYIRSGDIKALAEVDYR